MRTMVFVETIKGVLIYKLRPPSRRYRSRLSKQTSGIVSAPPVAVKPRRLCCVSNRDYFEGLVKCCKSFRLKTREDAFKRH